VRRLIVKSDALHRNGQVGTSRMRCNKSETMPQGENGLRMLRENELPLWDDLAARSPQGSIFCSSWWLRAACGTQQVLGLFEGGRLVAGMPLYYERRFGIRICTMPKLTPAWGVVMEPYTGKAITANSREFTILRFFADYASGMRFFDQRFHIAQQNWLPFYWKGLVHTSRVTYIIDTLNDCSAVWANMDDCTRRCIRKAERLGIRVTPGSVDDVWEMVSESFRRQGRKVSYTREYLGRLLEAAIEHNQGMNFAARDSAGRLHAAGFLVWDSTRAYSLVCGANSEGRASGASSLLMWHMIQFSSERAQVFDLEGSMLQGVERFMRGFGGQRITYNWVMTFPVWLYVYLRSA
jgi:hypothetical protein